MPLLQIYINNRPYQLACDNGEESHVSELAQEFDVEVRQLVNAVGQAPDNMLFLMAGLTLADRVGELSREIAMLKRQVDQHQKEASLRKVSKKAAQAGTRDMLENVANRIEKIASDLE